jgi:ankyrin repeat protein
MDYKQQVLKLFCQYNDFYWIEKYATAEILNSEVAPGIPFIFRLFCECSVSERVLKTFVKLGLNIKCTHHNTNTLLHTCQWFENYRCIPFLVECGLNINSKGFGEHTPLTYALYNNTRFELVKKLLEMGADVTSYLYKGRSIVEIAEKTGKHYYIRMVRCRMAMDTLVCCLRRYSVSRDMIRLIRQFVWKTRLLECWDKIEASNKKIKN